MIRSIAYLVVFLSSFILISCSLKYKWRTKGKESLSQRKQEHLSHLLTSEQVVVDSTIHFSYSDLQNYHLWTFSGNVKIAPNGTFYTDHAILQSWQKTSDNQQTTSSKTIYQNKVLAKESLTEETIDRNKHSAEKKKWKTSTNWWWLLLLFISIGTWFFVNRDS